MLADGWRCTATAPGAYDAPGALASHAGPWTAATVPGTAAGALRAAGTWSLDGPARAFDAEDWWFETTFDALPGEAGAEDWLCFDGLASVADVWLNGAPLLSSAGMFTAHEVRVDGRLAPRNTLAIRFRALDALLAQKRPRPRWRAPMVASQQLRWVRTTLLGRTPGWSPPAAAVGPWRAVRLERRRVLALDDLRLRADADGRVDCAVRVTPVAGGAAPDEVTLVLARGAQRFRVGLAPGDDGHWAARATLDDVARWWPHTHGEPACYLAALECRAGTRTHRAPIGPVGFRTIAVDTADGDFRVRVNGVPVFCRGACWTPPDVVRLDADEAALDAAFAQLRDAGMNMLRVSGTMAYESDAFLDRCDAHGVLLWQDLMFANMDYPEDDAAFDAEAGREVAQQLARLQGRPALAVVCGNSEVGQQAAMWGAPRARWTPSLFHERFARLAAEALPGVPYWPSSAHGGAFPHQASAGTTSYYGVGAYRRPLDDARRAAVRFATECLAFANPPERATHARMPGGLALRPGDEAWRARAPRDLGADWDFEQVRDHYVASCFGVDPLAVRAADPAWYLELGRVAVGEAMAATFLEWRRAGSPTRGALVWFLRDLWRGAGWGVVDADGRPKVPWLYLRRALAPLAVGITDEGVNGLAVHAINDRAEAFAGAIELACHRADGVRTGHATLDLTVPARGAVARSAVEWFDEFRDLSDAYRFGRRDQDVVVATLCGPDGVARARAVHCIGGLPGARQADVGLEATLEAAPGGGAHRALHVRTRALALAVRVDVPGFRPEDDAFHLAPGESRRIALVADPAFGAAAPGEVRALNSAAVVPLPAA